MFRSHLIWFIRRFSIIILWVVSSSSTSISRSSSGFSGVFEVSTGSYQLLACWWNCIKFGTILLIANFLIIINCDISIYFLNFLILFDVFIVIKLSRFLLHLALPLSIEVLASIIFLIWYALRLVLRIFASSTTDTHGIYLRWDLIQLFKKLLEVVL